MGAHAAAVQAQQFAELVACGRQEISGGSQQMSIRMPSVARILAQLPKR
jgi:hypothetical protein